MIPNIKYIAAAIGLLCCSGCLYAQSADADAALTDGLSAMRRYDFKTARTRLTKYKELATRQKFTPDARAQEALDAISLAEDMLSGQVEKVVIIDSIAVPREEFFKAYKLSPSSGTLPAEVNMAAMGEAWEALRPSGPAYQSEDGTLRYVAAHTETVDEESGTVTPITRIFEGYRLADGSWSEPEALFGEDVDAAFPFMLSDGCTFFFASRSEQGLGGYDIFRSYRDSDSGEFQNPTNMGMPYNSPADDYMLAIDEYTGSGWWATDRNAPEGMVNIYVFIPSQTRRNYDADTPDIESLAALWTLHFPQETALPEQDEAEGKTPTAQPGWKLTWEDGTDYDELLADIAEVGNRAPQAPEEDFLFVGDGGRVYTLFDELPRGARQPMLAYMAAQEAQQSAEQTLSEMRTAYPDGTSAADILTAEQRTQQLREATKQARNALFKILRGE